MTAAELVPYIQNLVEGGYYHPDMYKTNPRLFSYVNGQYNEQVSKAYAQSGETMFGLDRKAGAPLTTQGAAQEAFWRLVDQYYTKHHADTSYWGDMANGKKADIPASVGQQLRKYGGEIILSILATYTNTYLKDATVKNTIYNYPPLLLQFLYAAWNGPVFFSKLANVVKNAIANGTTDPAQIYSLVSQYRRNYSSQFAIGADKLDTIVAKYLGGLPTKVTKEDGSSGGWWKWLLAGVAVFGLVKILSKK